MVGFGKPVDSNPRDHNVLDGEDVDWRWRVAEGGLHRQQRTRSTSRFVVPVMEVGPGFLGVRDRTRFIARQCQRRANDSELANHDQ